MNKILSVMCVVFLLWPSILLAQDTPIITDLAEGEPAPFLGSLLNPAAMAQILVERENDSLECNLRVDYAIQREQTSCELWRDIQAVELEALQDQYNAVTSIKDGEIERLTDIITESSGDNDIWWFAGGLLLGIAASVGIAFALDSF